MFSLARRESDEAAGYDVVLAAETMAPVTTGAGVRVLPDVTFDDLSTKRIDTLIVPGAVEIDSRRRVHPLTDPHVVARVKQLADRTRRVTSVCVGAHILAAAGLLDGKRATTHWSTAQQLAADHPAVEVDADPIFVREGDVWTGAGISACLDLSLALVADDLGEAIALSVARQLVMYLKRPSGQSQFSVPLEQLSTTRRIEDLRHHIMRNIGEPLTVADLAEYAHISDRQLTRIFKTELGTTPHAYIESARVEAARSGSNPPTPPSNASRPRADSAPWTPSSGRSAADSTRHRPSTGAASGPAGPERRHLGPRRSQAEAESAAAVSRANASGLSSMMLCPQSGTGTSRTPASVSAPAPAGAPSASGYR